MGDKCANCGDAVTREGDELVGSDGEVNCPSPFNQGPHGPAVPDDAVIRLTARLTLEYDPRDGLVATPEEAKQDFYDCLHSFGPGDFTVEAEIINNDDEADPTFAEWAKMWIDASDDPDADSDDLITNARSVLTEYLAKED